MPIAADCHALLSALLAKLPEARVGSAAELRACAFFDGFDWEALAARRLAAPYSPNIAHALDTSNVITLDKYVCPASDEEGERWDRYLSTAMLRSGTDPFAGFSTCDQAWRIDGQTLHGRDAAGGRVGPAGAATT